MSHNHSNTCSCCCSHYPDLLQKICPTRTWEVDRSTTKRHFDPPKPSRRSHGCKCSNGKKVKGKFGVAWICETPGCSCCEPFGWQVEFTDTPSKVEQRCREMIEWVNKPPLPKNDEGNKGENCKCKKPQNEEKYHCSCSEPKQLIRCQCNTTYKERYLRHLCECESPEIENDDYCSCNRRNSCECCKCKCGSTVDEVPEKDTPKGDTNEKKSKGNVTEETNTEEKSVPGTPRTVDNRSTTRTARSGNLQPSAPIAAPNEIAREQRDVTRRAAGPTRIETPASVQDEGRLRRGGAVISQFLVQSGDITLGDGTGGESIYGERFNDENLELKHEAEGTVGMANCGPNTNNSQFYITTVPCPHLDGLNVVVGKVQKGLNILREMANLPKRDDKPLEKCIIGDCGEFKPGESWKIEECDGTSDVYPPWPNDWDCVPDEAQIESVIEDIKESGNYYYHKTNYVDSDRKYKKALRYIDWLISSQKKYDTANIKSMKISSLLNLAAVRLKKGKHKDVVDICDQVLAIDNRNGKALYRRAQGKMGTKDYDGAIKDLSKALDICPNDKHVQTKLEMVKKQKLEYLKLEKQTFSKIFQ